MTLWRWKSQATAPLRAVLRHSTGQRTVSTADRRRGLSDWKRTRRCGSAPVPRCADRKVDWPLHSFDHIVPESARKYTRMLCFIPQRGRVWKTTILRNAVKLRCHAEARYSRDSQVGRLKISTALRVTPSLRSACRRSIFRGTDRGRAFGGRGRGRAVIRRRVLRSAGNSGCDSPEGMKYKNLGRSGLKVSELSFGSWITFGGGLDSDGVKRCMKRAFDLGVNFFDNAEVYAKGESETLMGEAARSFRREDLVISTKIFWGGNGPNDTGLSWKHLVEGTRNSLRRMKLSYVDILYCHRPDPTTPVDETVRAMDHIIKSGYAFYWGTSEWSAAQLQAAYDAAERYNCIPPTVEQPQYNLFYRGRVEREYDPIYKKYGIGLTTWSPLCSGILTGKYADGIPKGSRLDKNDWLQKELTPSRVAQVKKLSEIASELDCSLTQLSIAWCLKNPHVSSVILGASNEAQIEENVRAAEIKDRLTDTVMRAIDKVVS